MKSLLAAFLLLCPGLAGAELQKIYELKMNRDSDELGLGTNYEFMEYYPGMDKCVMTHIKPDFFSYAVGNRKQDEWQETLSSQQCDIFKIAEKIKANFGGVCELTKPLVLKNAEKKEKNSDDSSYRYQKVVRMDQRCVCTI